MQEPNRCHYFVAHKNRLCRMLARVGKLYCGQHQVGNHSQDENCHTRIPCPLDPKHSVNSHQLEQHLAVCNSRPPVHLPYYCPHANYGTPPSSNVEEDCVSDHASNNFKIECNSAATQLELDKFKVKQIHLNGKSIAELTDAELLTFINFVMACEKKYTEKIIADELNHESMVQILMDCNSKSCTSAFRNWSQNASLVAHLENIGFPTTKSINNSSSTFEATELEKNEKNTSLAQSVCFIEFGAGKGQLSHCVALAVAPEVKLQTVLVDRGSQRYKFDSRIKELDDNRAMRLRVDIAHLVLDKVPGLLLTANKVFAGGKHLCGAATDLSIRCLINSTFLRESDMDEASYSSNLSKNIDLSSFNACVLNTRGLVVALCCHHRCEWQHYVGKQFLQDVGLSESCFTALCGLTSWAVCAARPPAVRQETTNNHLPAILASDTTAPDKEETDDSLLLVPYPNTSISKNISSDYDNAKVDGGTHVDETESVHAINRYLRLGLGITLREKVGKAAKHLLDHGRVLKLRELGLHVKLVRYVDSSVTLENIALVAHN